LKKLLCLGLLTILLLITGLYRGVFVYGDSGGQSVDSDFSPSSFRNQNYYRKLQSWTSEYDVVDIAETEYAWDPFIGTNPLVTFNNSPGYHGTYAELGKSQSVTMTITAETAALYELGFDFRMPDVFYTIPTIELMINGEYPFNEASSLELEVTWTIEPLPRQKDTTVTVTNCCRRPSVRICGVVTTSMTTTA